MVIQSVWLLHHKVSLDPSSPANLDGSEFMLGVGVVPASSMKEALSLFDAYLKENKMELLELWKCEQWNSQNYNSGSVADGQINNASAKALERNLIHYTCGASSEALACEEEMFK